MSYSEEDEYIVLYESPLTTIWQVEDILFATHTACGWEGQWWYGSCQQCKTPTPSQFKIMGDNGSEMYVSEGAQVIQQWAAIWLEVDEARVEVSIS